MGKAALLFKAGGSIPALAILQRHLGVEPVSFGFTLDTDALHSPNELFRLTMYEKAHRAFVHLLVALAKQPGKTAKGASLERDEL